MSIDPKLLLSNFPAISVILGLLIFGKTLLVTFVGRVFGVSTIAAIRVGLLLAPGGEFAFVAFGEAVNQVTYVVFIFFFFSRTMQESLTQYRTLSSTQAHTRKKHTITAQQAPKQP